MSVYKQTMTKSQRSEWHLSFLNPLFAHYYPNTKVTYNNIQKRWIANCFVPNNHIYKFFFSYLNLTDLKQTSYFPTIIFLLFT